MDAKEAVYCKECGSLMEWVFSQGTYGDGAWIIRCRNSGTVEQPGCFMASATFTPDRYDQQFAQSKAVRLIHHARTGIIYRNQQGTAEEWIAEAVKKGIVPENWRQWGIQPVAVAS